MHTANINQVWSNERLTALFKTKSLPHRKEVIYMEEPHKNGNPHLSREVLRELRARYPERSGLIQAYGLVEFSMARLNPSSSGSHTLESLGITTQDQVTLMFEELKQLAIEEGLITDPSVQSGGQS
jgi:hypothetical protein